MPRQPDPIGRNAPAGPWPPPEPQVDREARLFGHYLIGSKPTPQVTRIYKGVLIHREAELRPSSRCLRMARRFPFLLGLLDAGCARLRPNDALRRRLLAMAAVLEVQPSNARHFLEDAKPGRVRTILLLGAIGVWAVIKTTAGVALTAVITVGERRS